MTVGTLATMPNGSGRRDSVAVLVILVNVALATCLMATAQESWVTFTREFDKALPLVALTVVLQLLAVDVYGRGSIAVSGIGMLAVGFTFGVGPAMIVAIIAAAAHAVRTRGRLRKAAFNAASFALAAGAGSLVYLALVSANASMLVRLLAACVGGILFWAVNIGLLTMAMSIDEGISPAAVWGERFRWLTGHYIAFGPLAVAAALSYDNLGPAGLVAFTLPPALVILSVRQYLERTRRAVEEVRQANDELAARNLDLRDLFEFAGGLGARTHDRGELVAYAEEALGRLVGGRIEVREPREAEIELTSGGVIVGSLAVDGKVLDRVRWERLRDALIPQLATALESAQLVGRVKQTHLDTIAALSKSMEAKDYYTGGHTERVSDVAVALARRLGYSGSDLESIEIGALLHDIGKIGIPERILHKPGPLDPEEWKVMKDHPVISDYILSEVELNPIVKQIARSSHERIDGMGYPDGLAGDDIPLPARIVLVADAFDALTTDRPYRSGRHVDAALGELRTHAGTQFCSTVVAALEDLYREEPHILGIGKLRAVKVA